MTSRPRSRGADCFPGRRPIVRPADRPPGNPAVWTSSSLLFVVFSCCIVTFYGNVIACDSASARALVHWVRAEAAPAGLNTATAGTQPNSLVSLPWPEGTQVLPFEDLEGVILLRARLIPTSGRDTSGLFVLDTGAGFLALDLELARRLGIADSAVAAAVDLTARPLARLELGSLQMDQVSPVLTVDAGVVRRVTGRPILGLLGQALFRDRVVLLDYRENTLLLLPPEADPDPALAGPRAVMSANAVGVPFRLAGDGKVLVPARVTGRAGQPPAELSLIVDTGATKAVLFRAALDRHLPGWTAWPALRGLGAPTLTGDASAELVRVPGIELRGLKGSVSRPGVDAAVLGGDLGEVLAADVGEPVDGLLGYSFLKHFRIALDYPRHLLWLDPSRGDVADRLEEYCHPGLQLEDVGGVVRVFAVAEGSPAARVGVRAGDELVALDGESVAGLDVSTIARRLEGAAGSRLLMRLRRGQHEWTCRLVRRQLL
jgi:predicted aspartyl protease